MGQALHAWSTLLVLIPLALAGTGCNGWFRPVEWSELGPQNQRQQPLFRVVAKQSRDVASVTPDDVVNVMQRVGFADEQILDLGTDLHNALRFSGSASILYRKDTVAMFRINAGYLQVRTRSGILDYDIVRSRFVAAPMGER